MAKRRAIASLSVSLIARTKKFTQGLKRALSNINNFGRGVKKTSRGVRTLNVAMARLGKIAGAVAIGRGLINLARRQEEFNRSLRQSQAIMGDLSDTMRVDMKRAAIELARTTIFTGEQAGKAFFFLASAGLDAKTSIEALPIVSKFAQAGMFDLSLATDLLTDAQSALGLSVDDTAQTLENMTQVADVLVKANTLANASVQQFSEALTTKAGAALKVLGKDIEEGVAVLAAFADQGIKAAEAGTALNIVLRDLSTKALRNNKAFKEAGVVVFDAAGEMRNIADIVGDVEKALDGMSDALAKDTLLTLGFTDKSVIFLQTLLGLSGRIRDYEKGLRSAGGTMSEVSDKMLTPLQQAMAKFNAVTLEASESLGAFVEGAANATTEAASLFDRMVAFTLRLGQVTVDAAGDIRFVKNEFARISDLTGKITFDSEKEERTILRMAGLFDEMRAKQKKAANAAKAIPSIVGGGVPIDLGELTAFRTRLEAIRLELSNIGLSDVEIRLKSLTRAFQDAEGRIPVELFEQGKNAILDMADAMMFLERRQKAAARIAEVHNRAVADGEAIFRRTRTPFEQLEESIKRVTELFVAGLLPGGLETLNREIARLKQQLSPTGRAVVGRRITAMQISPSRTFLPGLQTNRNQAQLVMDPQLARLIDLTIRQNRLIERDSSIAVTN